MFASLCEQRPTVAFCLLFLPSLLRLLRLLFFPFPHFRIFFSSFPFLAFLQLLFVFSFISFRLLFPIGPCTVYVFFFLHVSAPLLWGPWFGSPHTFMHNTPIHSSLINAYLYTLLQPLPSPAVADIGMVQPRPGMSVPSFLPSASMPPVWLPDAPPTRRRAD